MFKQKKHTGAGAVHIIENTTEKANKVIAQINASLNGRLGITTDDIRQGKRLPGAFDFYYLWFFGSHYIASIEYDNSEQFEMLLNYTLDHVKKNMFGGFAHGAHDENGRVINTSLYRKNFPDKNEGDKGFYSGRLNYFREQATLCVEDAWCVNDDSGRYKEAAFQLIEKAFPTSGVERSKIFPVAEMGFTVSRYKWITDRYKLSFNVPLKPRFLVLD